MSAQNMYAGLELFGTQQPNWVSQCDRLLYLHCRRLYAVGRRSV